MKCASKHLARLSSKNGKRILQFPSLSPTNPNPNLFWMKISIVTPSFRNSEWLKLCIASVADQEGVLTEHIVQDGGSDDGTLAWLLSDPRVTAYVEKDHGMYDAINRGFQRASGDVVAWLNCDEQYLPGGLAEVAHYFKANPEIDVLIADSIIVDAEGNYICHRYGLRPFLCQLWHRFPVLSCSLFVRRRVVSELGLFLDRKWRVLGDLFWVMDMLRHGLRFGVLRRFLSAFTETGENLALSPAAVCEQPMKLAEMPRWIRLARPMLLLIHRFRLVFSGVYFQKPFSYSLYTLNNSLRRTTHHVLHPKARWRNRA